MKMKDFVNYLKDFYWTDETNIDNHIAIILHCISLRRKK